MEIVSQGAKLSGKLILKILKSLNELFENKEKQKDFILNDNSKESKQKIKDLVSKHKDGLTTLDDNLTKEQINDYKKELKKTGIDFSVVKNRKDNYSFFFAGKDAGILEKGLKNVVENLENEKRKH